MQNQAIISAIESLLKTCDEKTQRMIAAKYYVKQVPVKKNLIVSKHFAREDLIKNHFKQ